MPWDFSFFINANHQDRHRLAVHRLGIRRRQSCRLCMMRG